MTTPEKAISGFPLASSINEADVVLGNVSGQTSQIPSSVIRTRMNTGNQSISGTVTATAFVGNGTGLTGIGTGTGGVINTGSTTIGADSDVDSVGIVDIQTRTVSRLQILNNGDAYFLQKVGIGTNTPAASLHIYSAAGTNELRMSGGSGVVNRLSWQATKYLEYSQTSGNIALANASAKDMVITSGGLVGFGTDTPASSAGIDKFIEIEDLTNGNKVGVVLTAYTKSMSVYVKGESAAPATDGMYFTDDTDATALFIRATDGNIGVKTTAPGAALDVLDDVASSYVANFQNDGNNANRYGIQVQAGADDGSGVTRYFNALDGNGDPVGYLEMNGGTFQLVDVSDERSKEDIVPTSIVGEEVIMSIEIKDYTRKKSKERIHCAGTAQNMIGAFPRAVSGKPGDIEEYIESPEIVDDNGIVIQEAVIKTRDKMAGITEAPLVWPLIKHNQEQQIMINDLKKRVETLENN